MVNIVGSAYVDIHAQDKHFEAEVRRAVNKIGKQKISIEANVLLSKANTNLAKFRKRNNARPIEINLNVNTDLAEKRTEEFYAENDGKVLSMNLEINHTSAWASLAKLKNSVAARGILTMKSELDLDFMHEQIEEFEQHYANNPIMLTSELDTGAAYRALQTVQAIGESDPVELDVKADVKRAEAIMAHLARDRQAEIKANVSRSSLRDAEQIIASSSTNAFRLFSGGGNNPLAKIFRDPEIQDAIEGFTNATAGIIPVKAIKTVVTSLAANFEELSVATAKWGTVVGAALGAAGAALGFGARLIEDVSQAFGVVAALPAVIATVVAATQSLKMAWSGMGDAIQLDAEKSAKAMAELPPKARATAKAIRDINVAVNEVTDEKYWDRLGNSVVKAANAIKGPLTQGMGQVAVAMADNTTALAKSIEDFGKDGSMKTTFDNMVEGLQNATVGTQTFSEALLTITEEGSKRIPELGEWFSKLGTQFNDFITDSAESGAILDWIDTGVQRLEELGSILANTGRMFGILEQAASDAGIGGLTDLANAFEVAADYASNPIFRATLIDLFRDAKVSTENLASGLKSVWDGLLERAPEVGDILLSTSEAMEAVLDGVGSMFSDTSMMDGLVKFFQGVSQGAQDLAPTFESLGNAIGDLGEMGGVLIENLVPGLNILMDTFEGFIANMKDGWLAVNPVLNELVQIITTLMSGPIKTMGTVLGGVLQIIADTPASILIAVASFVALNKAIGALGAIKIGGTLLSSMPLIGTAISTMTAGATMSFTGMKDKMVNSSKQALTGVKQMSSGTGSVLKSMAGTYAATGLMMAGQFDRSRETIDKTKGAATGLQTAVKGVGTTARGVGGMMRTAFAPIGGLLKAALPLAILAGAISIFGDIQYAAQVSANSVADLTGEFDALTGKLSDNGIEAAISRIGKVGEEGFFSFMSDVSDNLGWSQPVTDELEKIGHGTEEVRKNLSGSVSDIREYAGSWNHANVEWKKFTDSTGSFDHRAFIDQLEAADPGIFKRMKIDVDQLRDGSAQTFSTIMGGLGGAAGEAYKAASNMKSLQEVLENISNDAPKELFAFAESGGDSTEGLRQALVNANEAAGTLNANFETLADNAATVEQKMSAFKSNQSLLGLENLSDTGGLKEYYATLDQMPSAVESVKTALEGTKHTMKDLYSVNKDGLLTFNHNIGAAREMHTALTTQTDGTKTAIVGMYSSAIKGGESYASALSMAMDEAGRVVGTLDLEGKLVKPLKDYRPDTLVGQLRDSFDMGEEAIEAFLQTAGLVPESIETALNIDGAAEARRQVILTQVAAQAFATGDYTGFVRLISDDAEKALEDLLVNGENLNKADLKLHVEAAVTEAQVDLDTFWQTVAKHDGDIMKAMVELGIKGEGLVADSLASVKTQAESIKALVPIDADGGPAKKEIASVNAAVAKIKESKKVDIKVVSNAIKQADAAIAKLAAIPKSKDPKINADNRDLLAKARAARAELVNIRDKHVNLTATDGVSGVIARINGLGLKSKTMNINTRYSGAAMWNAKGSIINGQGIQTFAKGGINKAKQAVNMHSFAKGSEKHVAQIAKGGWPYRVWAEPETGGEAYIPLHKNKRDRSMKILEQVAAHFGVSFAEFANGGMLGGKKSSGGVTSFATGGTTTKLTTAQKEARQKAAERATEAKKIYAQVMADMRTFLSTMTKGISTIFGGAKESPVQSEIANMRKQASTFITEYKKTRPKEAKAMASLSRSLIGQTKTSRFWQSKTANTDDATALANDMQRRQKTRTAKDDIRWGVSLRDYEHAIGLVNAKLEKTKATLESIKGLRDSAASSLTSTMNNELSVGSLLGSKDEFGYRAPVSAQQISTYAKDVVARMKNFRSKLYQLRKAGYNDFFVTEIAGMGIDDGMFIADSLLADQSQLKSINGSYEAIKGTFSNSTGEMVGGLSKAIGDFSADSMYKAGISIQQGLVAGLTADVSALEKAAQTLSNTLVARFKKLLGIKSPSRVFAKEARFIPQGIIMGLDQEQANLDRRLGSLVTTKASNLDLSRSSSSGNRNGTMVGATAPSIVQHIHPTPGMSEEQVGQSSARELMFRLDYR